MSEADVELVRSGIRAWLEQFVDPDSLFVQDALVWPEAGTWHGHDGWRAVVAAWVAQFDEWTVEFHDVLDVGDGRVVVVFSDSGIGRQSGVLVQRPKGAFVYTMRDGKVVHTEQYGLAEDALRAVGLHPER